MKWLLVPDAGHGFDMNMEQIIKDKVVVEDARVKTGKVVELVAEWLLEVTK